MCNHCRSARMENETTGVREKTVVFARTLESPSSNSRSHRPENTTADGACCAQWKKTCCGGGCCDSTNSNSPCCGIQHSGTVRQSHPPQYRKTMYRTENVGGSSGYPQSVQQPGWFDNNCNTGYAASNMMAVPCGVGGQTSRNGVCPAMMRNLPCTPISKPKCTGGDCRDDEDTDSENSRKI